MGDEESGLWGMKRWDGEELGTGGGEGITGSCEFP